ncbi:MAG: mechanosensitive ion channel domain-containing protein [Pseudomonadota bacterium]
MAAEELSVEQLQKYTDQIIEKAIDAAPGILLAILFLIIGLWVIGRVVKLLEAGLQRSQTDATLAKFLTSLVSIILKALLFISAASMVGVETTSFVAILGAAGLAIGLALQGSLSNFAGGVLILLFRPYKVGDFVEAQGVSGSVAEIQIFNTVLLTPDNKRIIVPNGAISNGIITNYSAEPKRRIDFVFGIGYDDDIALAKQTLMEIFSADERIHADPAPFVVLSELADSSVNFTCRVWADAGDYWGIYFDTTEAVKVTFDAKGLSIPYPQSDVHLHRVE